MCIPSVLVLKTIGNVSVVETETKEEATVGGSLRSSFNMGAGQTAARVRSLLKLM